MYVPARRQQLLQAISNSRRKILEQAERNNIAIVIRDEFTDGMLYNEFKLGTATQRVRVFGSDERIPEVYTNRLTINISASFQLAAAPEKKGVDVLCHYFDSCEHGDLFTYLVAEAKSYQGQCIDLCYRTMRSTRNLLDYYIAAK